eukprot:TRINITY_DN2243_c0_g1_i5.p1 TRINITY_DN2243_c0_g1~~TRINITY_DN2243_c0_g1_i5.p1  ORF type:complete len:410 (+),score=56.83 TRINITY_DN2243_c0_g1_i5:313-1542(+)
MCSEAYETLKDDHKRKAYDQNLSFQYFTGEEEEVYQYTTEEDSDDEIDVNIFWQGRKKPGFGRKKSSSFDSLFNEMFNDIFEVSEDEIEFPRSSSGFDKHKPRRPPGPIDINLKQRISFLQAVKGSQIELSFYAMRNCHPCNGKGVLQNSKAKEKSRCKVCQGLGVKYSRRGKESVCATCRGSGWTHSNGPTCPACHGSSVSIQGQTVTVDVPKGSENGDIIKLQRYGNHAGAADGRDGDLYVELVVETHQVFERKGLDIHIHTPISLSKALLGGPCCVPSIYGDVTIDLSPGVQHGQIHTIKNHGISKIVRDSKTVTGNLYVHLEPQIPKHLTPNQMEMIRLFEKDEINVSTSYAHTNTTTESQKGADYQKKESVDNRKSNPTKAQSRRKYERENGSNTRRKRTRARI